MPPFSTEAEKLAAARKFADAVAVLDKALAIEGLTDEQKQDVLFKQGMYQFNLKDFAAALETHEESRRSRSRKRTRPRKSKVGLRMFTMIVEGQASIAKDMEGLEKAEGLDRAKLLDQLIQANTKLQMYGAAKLTPAEIAKWTAEIVELDADNKAGLKIKYEFTKFLGEASTLAREKKFEEGLAAIDKALALAGITPEQTQEGLMAKGTNYLAAEGLREEPRQLQESPRSRSARSPRRHPQYLYRQCRTAAEESRRSRPRRMSRKRKKRQ